MAHNEHDVERERFHRELEAVVGRAVANGVDIAAGWPVRNTDDGDPDWDIEIVELD